MAQSLPSVDLKDSPTGCCPRFDPAPWDGGEFSLEGLRFIKAQTRSFLFMPLDMTKVMTETQKAIDAAGAAPKDRYLMLSRDLSPWKCEHYFLVEGDVAGFETLELPGSFLAKVFEGSYNNMGNWYKGITAFAKERGFAFKELFAFYTTCPACAKAYGKNYVVLLARSA
jgi:hypothetical protein